MNTYTFVLAVENAEGHIDYGRENFVRLNPDIPNTADNWYQWRVKVSQNRLRKLDEYIKTEVLKEGTPF